MTDAETKRIFGQRLKALLLSRGMNASELSRQASRIGGVNITRDSVSKYLRGEDWPNDKRRDAIAKALRVDEADLNPNLASGKAGRLEMRQLTDGRALVIIEAAMPYDRALEIMAIARKE